MRTKSWAEQRLAEIEFKLPALKEKSDNYRNESRILLTAGMIFWFAGLVALNWLQNRAWPIMGAGILLFVLHSVWEMRGIKPKVEYDVARWEVDTLRLALQLAEGIAHEITNGGNDSGTASVQATPQDSQATKR